MSDRDAVVTGEQWLGPTQSRMRALVDELGLESSTDARARR